MKTKFAMLLTLVFLLSILLPACQSGGDDAPSGSPESSGTPESAPQKEVPILNVEADIGPLAGDWVMRFLQSVPGYGTDFVAISETTPRGGQNRDNTLTRLKTEIMAGKGPDLFLCTNYTYGDEGDLFPFPQKAMKNHLLLPLDGYIENAEYMEWDKLLPIVMEAGRNDEGQQILPLTFNFLVHGVNTESYTMDAQMPMTWEESLACGDPWVRYSASSGGIQETYGDIINLEDDTLRVSEEDLATWFRQRREIDDARERGEFPEFTEYSEEFGFHVSKGIADDEFEVFMNIGSFSLNWEKNPLDRGADYWLAPVYNTDGGITASIDTFAAINRNTEYPEFCFRILDRLLAESTQYGPLFSSLFGMPVHMDVGMGDDRGPGWSMNDWNREQYLALRDQINVVKFNTPVGIELEKAFGDYYDTGDLEGSVHKHYVTALMMLAES